MLGALLTGIFASEALGGTGIPSGASIGQQLWLQLFAILAAGGWSGGVSLLLLWCLNRTLGLRVTPDQETEGLDVALHNGKAYHL